MSGRHDRGSRVHELNSLVFETITLIWNSGLEALRNGEAERGLDASTKVA